MKDPKTLLSVPRDGKTMGEISLKGNILLKGYFKDEKQTSRVFRNGWLLTEDVAVVHPDGYLEIKDQLKDVIISGGENISNVEPENVLYRHPRVFEAAVVAMPNPRRGESPCAFITIRPNPTGRTNDVSKKEIMVYCRRNLPTSWHPIGLNFCLSYLRLPQEKSKSFN